MKIYNSPGTGQFDAAAISSFATEVPGCIFKSPKCELNQQEDCGTHVLRNEVASAFNVMNSVNGYCRYAVDSALTFIDKYIL